MRWGGGSLRALGTPAPAAADLAELLPASRRPQPAPTTGAARVARATILGATSELLATAAHLTGGGRLPSAGVLTVVGILLALVAVTVTARRCRTGLLLVVLGVQQVALHLVFEAAASVGSHCPLPETVMHHGAPLRLALARCPEPVMAGPAMHWPGGWTMWVGHVAATVLTALLLARGETWLWQVADRVVASATAAPGRRRISGSRRAGCSAAFSLVGSRSFAPAAPRGPPGPIVS